MQDNLKFNIYVIVYAFITLNLEKLFAFAITNSHYSLKTFFIIITKIS